jgi:rhodanese-related sulfurtransferase
MYFGISIYKNKRLSMYSHKTKESLVFILGFGGILCVIIFYWYQFFVRPTPVTPATKQPTITTPSDQDFIPYDKLSALLANPTDLTLLDIRTNELFANEHIPRSINTPLEFLDSITLDPQKTIVILTSAGDEQGLGISTLQFLRAKNASASIAILKGGFEGWKNNGGQVVSFGYQDSTTDYAKVSFIPSEDLKKLIATKRPLLVVDMRSNEAYTEGHPPKSINIPLDQLEEKYENLPLGIPLIVYGNSALEDFQAGVRLFDLGYFSTKILKGGFQDWKTKGFPVEK